MLLSAACLGFRTVLDFVLFGRLIRSRMPHAVSVRRLKGLPRASSSLCLAAHALPPARAALCQCFTPAGIAMTTPGTSAGARFERIVAGPQGIVGFAL